MAKIHKKIQNGMSDMEQYRLLKKRSIATVSMHILIFVKFMLDYILFIIRKVIGNFSIYVSCEILICQFGGSLHKVFNSLFRSRANRTFAVNETVLFSININFAMVSRRKINMFYMFCNKIAIIVIMVTIKRGTFNNKTIVGVANHLSDTHKFFISTIYKTLAKNIIFYNKNMIRSIFIGVNAVEKYIAFSDRLDIGKVIVKTKPHLCAFPKYRCMCRNIPNPQFTVFLNNSGIGIIEIGNNPFLFFFIVSPSKIFAFVNAIERIGNYHFPIGCEGQFIGRVPKVGISIKLVVFPLKVPFTQNFVTFVSAGG